MNGIESNGSLDKGLTFALTLRLRSQRLPGTLAKVINCISRLGGLVQGIDTLSATAQDLSRDITFLVKDGEHGRQVVNSIRRQKGVDVIHVSDRVFLVHLGGKIEVRPRAPVKTRDDLSLIYTPGVARVCRAIFERPEDAYHLTIKRNSVAIVTDGSAVLGLGDLGPKAAMPVMEGKAALFKTFANIDAYPLCLDTKDPQEIVETVRHVAPGFGGINLEDISAPRCFEIENRLKKILDIPVFHDDQHGTAIVVTAALLNSLRLVNKKIPKIRVVLMGAGAAGLAVVRMLRAIGVRQIITFDRTGAIYRGRRDGMNEAKELLAKMTNPDRFSGLAKEALRGADVFVGVSQGGLFQPKDFKAMAKDGIVFALANPDPEVDPVKVSRYVRVVATGRSDYPNQINNALAFPGVFRGALDIRAQEINEPMKIAAARTLAAAVETDLLREDYVIPSIFNKQIVPLISTAVAKAAQRSGVVLPKSTTVTTPV